MNYYLKYLNGYNKYIYDMEQYYSDTDSDSDRENREKRKKERKENIKKYLTPIQQLIFDKEYERVTDQMEMDYDYDVEKDDHWVATSNTKLDISL
jgi:hypothetical protein